MLPRCVRVCLVIGGVALLFFQVLPRCVHVHFAIGVTVVVGVEVRKWLRTANPNIIKVTTTLVFCSSVNPSVYTSEIGVHVCVFSVFLYSSALLAAKKGCKLFRTAVSFRGANYSEFE